MTYIVGLTGGIGSGKSAAAERFRALGITVVDADVCARIVVEPNKPALKTIAEHFGSEIIQADGTLDRAALRQKIFADEAERARSVVRADPGSVLRDGGFRLIRREGPKLFRVGARDGAARGGNRERRACASIHERHVRSCDKPPRVRKGGGLVGDGRERRRRRCAASTAAAWPLYAWPFGLPWTHAGHVRTAGTCASLRRHR